MYYYGTTQNPYWSFSYGINSGKSVLVLFWQFKCSIEVPWLTTSCELSLASFDCLCKAPVLTKVTSLASLKDPQSNAWNMNNGGSRVNNNDTAAEDMFQGFELLSHPYPVSIIVTAVMFLLSHKVNFCYNRVSSFVVLQILTRVHISHVCSLQSQ